MKTTDSWRPVKAALDSSLAFLAKSFSRDSHVRFNAVASGLLKTSASAGIPGYVDAYLYAEQVIPRKKALATQEVANVASVSAQPSLCRVSMPSRSSSMPACRSTISTTT